MNAKADDASDDVDAETNCMKILPKITKDKTLPDFDFIHGLLFKLCVQVQVKLGQSSSIGISIALSHPTSESPLFNLFPPLCVCFCMLLTEQICYVVSGFFYD